MAFLYGNPISDAERGELVQRLRLRGTTESVFAANALGTSARRDATSETAIQAREAILRELQDWPLLDHTNPRLALVRDRLRNPPTAERII